MAVKCEFLSYSPQHGRVGRGVQVGAETGTGRIQTTSARGLKGEGCGAWHLVFAGISAATTLIVRASLVHYLRGRNANWGCIGALVNEATFASQAVIWHLIVLEWAIKLALSTCTCHRVGTVLVSLTSLTKVLNWNTLHLIASTV